MAASLCTGASAHITPFFFNACAVRAFADAAGNPWFCANDVCFVLGYKNPRMSVERHCKAEGVLKRDTLTESGTQEMTFINEGNLYRLIVKSRKPEAVEFERKVMDEILPAIRKTGGYQQPGHMAQAVTAANAVAAQVQAAVFEQLLAGKSSWKYGRWMLSFSEGRDNAVTPCVMPIENDAAVMSLAQLAKAIVEPGGMMPSNTELANLAAACNKRLAERIEYQASKKITEVIRS